MGLINDLLGAIGGKKAPRTIADVEAALGRLANERIAAREAVARAMRDRDELLLVDESDKRIAELDAAADRCRLTLERCDKAEPLLLRELEQLRSEAKRAKWRELRSKYDAAAIDYANALRVAIEKMAPMLALNDEARSAGFEHETQSAFIPPARVISATSLNEFEVAIERARELARPAPVVVAIAPKVVAPAPKLKPAPPVAPKAAPPPKPPFVPPTPDANGTVEVLIIRPGIELPDHQRPRAGEKVRIAADHAAAIVRAGSGDYTS